MTVVTVIEFRLWRFPGRYEFDGGQGVQASLLLNAQPWLGLFLLVIRKAGRAGSGVQRVWRKKAGCRYFSELWAFA